MSNCSDFTLKKEDHTLGNLVSEHLKKHPNVLMAGYKSKSQPLPPPTWRKVNKCGAGFLRRKRLGLADMLAPAQNSRPP